MKAREAGLTRRDHKPRTVCCTIMLPLLMGWVWFESFRAMTGHSKLAELLAWTQDPKEPIATVTANNTDIFGALAGCLCLSFSCVISSPCTHRPRQRRASTQPATSFSVHDVGSWSLASYHRVRTVSSWHCTSTYYQAVIWTDSFQQHPQASSPMEHGWTRKDDNGMDERISSSWGSAAGAVVQVHP